MANNAYWIKRIEKERKRLDKTIQECSAQIYAQERRAYRAIEDKLRSLLDALGEKALDGRPINASDYYTFKRYTELMDTIKAKSGALVDAENDILERQLGAVFDGTFSGRGTIYQGGRDGFLPDNSPRTRFIQRANEAKETAVSFKTVSEEVKNRVIEGNWKGQNFKVTGTRNGEMFSERLQTLMENHFLMGDTKDIMSELQNTFGMKFHEAERLVRTESNHVYNEASKERYERLGIRKVEVSTYYEIDGENVCEACESLVTDAENHDGIYPLDSVPTLPVHPNCRCTYIPVIED